jgi:Spy/CpxP family protein refolding chaperone
MKKIGVFIAAALVMVSTSMFSNPPESKMHHKFMEQLKLSDEQKKDFDKIHVDMEKQEITQKAKNETARVELRQLFKADNPDKSAIEKKMDEIAGLEVQMHMIKINSWFEVNKILTPEQQKTWKKALEYVSEMHHRKMEMGRHFGHSMPPHKEEPMPNK